jgi:class 3 adenylate cyclase/tetratricopeptide (TPR) repeat protein
VAPVAERRVCSVLFADLVGFTPLSESRDPEEVRELLSRYFEAARTVIDRYGGVVEKFIGDAVMAVWGTPAAGEDDAERAVRAGLELLNAVSVLGAQAGVANLLARVGVVTGEVAVTLGAVGQGMAAGDAVNTAARVQAAASPGQVWVDETTHRLSAAAVGFTDCGEHHLKGKSQPVRLWAATRVLAGVGGAQRVDGLEAPLLGRDAELRLVKDLFHAAVDRRTPRMVVVSGPAGVGKSRLGWEFEKYVDGLVGQVWWHRGRCLSYGDGVVFWALAQIVRQRLGIAEEDAAEIAASKLEDKLAEYLTDPAERTYVAVRLGRLLGIPVTADSGSTLARAELFAGWRLFFERLAATEPVVLLIDDLQYADAGLLEFLDHLVDWARDVPIVVLVFTRPELEHARPGWASGRNRTGLTLDPLDRLSMDQLVEALVPGMPAVARRMIIGQAQGIPLFAVETIRSLIDRDVVVPREGVYTLVGDVGTLTVPDGLHALLAARLDALDPDLRVLVADAAVLGTSFPAEALVAVSGRDEATVRAGLAELLRREVLEVSADKLSPERGSYRFAQNLLGKVAYETLSRRDRKARHLAVAAHLRATFAGDGDEVIDAIARHYRDALVAVPDDSDAEQIRSEAVAALVRGAQRALRSGAPRGASANYAAAAGLLDEPRRTIPEHRGSTAPTGTVAPSADAASSWEAAAEADLLVGDYEAALEHAERAAAGHAAAGRPRDAARSEALAGRALNLEGRTTEAHDRLSAAVQVLRPEPDRDTVRVLAFLAGLAAMTGSGDADSLTSEALRLGQALDVDDGQLGRLFSNRGIFLSTDNRSAEAIASFEYAARVAERSGDSNGTAVALSNLSDVLLGIDPHAAAAAARASCDHARRIGGRSALAYAVVNLSTALILTGDWDAADSALAAAADTDGLDDVDENPAARGILAALRGDVAHAQQWAVLPRLRASEAPQDRAQSALLDALIAAAEGDDAGTLAHAREALAAIPAIGVRSEFVVQSWPPAIRAARALGDAEAALELLALLDTYPVGHLTALLRAERDLARARLAGDAGDPGADELFCTAVAAHRRVANPYYLAQALLDQAEFLATAGEPGRVDLLVVEARTIAETLRARTVVARADEISEMLVLDSAV